MTRIASIALVSASLAAAPAGAVTIVSTDIDADMHWTVSGSPYVITTSLGVVQGATLTIDPGVEVRLDPFVSFRVGTFFGGPGTLVARGTAESPIVFTSNATLPTPGDWREIVFGIPAVDASFDGDGEYLLGCIMEHCIGEYAGAQDFAAVTFQRCSPYLKDCEIRLNRAGAIFASDFERTPGLRIKGCDVHTNGTPGSPIPNSGGGMLIDGGSGHLITGNSIHGNNAFYGAGAFFVNATNMHFDGNVVSNNTCGVGGGLFLNVSDSFVSGNVISDNYAGAKGGGVYVTGSNVVFASNEIVDNESSQGAGVYVDGRGSALIASFAGDQGSGRFNTIAGNQAQCGQGTEAHNNTPAIVPAQFVCWGTDQSAAVQPLIYDSNDDASKGTIVIDPIVACGAQGSPFADLTGDGHVNAADLAVLLGAWGPCPAEGACEGDLVCSGIVDAADLAALLGAWTG